LRAAERAQCQFAIVAFSRTGSKTPPISGPHPVDTASPGRISLADHSAPAMPHVTHCTYLYDFGDDWSHEVLLEAIVPREAKLKYPRCLAGARVCPPEDCGDPHGYSRLCDILKGPNRTDEEVEEPVEGVARRHALSDTPAAVHRRCRAAGRASLETRASGDGSGDVTQGWR
jgi:hypothetical protein